MHSSDKEPVVQCLRFSIFYWHIRCQGRCGGSFVRCPDWNLFPPALAKIWRRPFIFKLWQISYNKNIFLDIFPNLMDLPTLCSFRKQFSPCLWLILTFIHVAKLFSYCCSAFFLLVRPHAVSFVSHRSRHNRFLIAFIVSHGSRLFNFLPYRKTINEICYNLKLQKTLKNLCSYFSC